MKMKNFTILTLFVVISSNLLSQSLNFVWAKSAKTYYEINAYTDSECRAFSNAVDNNGDVITCGQFKGKVDFNPGVNETEVNYLATPIVITNNHDYNGFIYKLNSSGNLLWAKRLYSSTLGGSFSGIEKVLVDNSNNIYIFGKFFNNLSFDPSTGGTITGANDNVFVLKLNPSGSVLWNKTFAGSNMDFRDADMDASGNIVMTTVSSSPITINGAGTSISTLNDLHLAFIKLNSSGSFQWSKSCNIAGGDNVGFMDIDGSGNIYYAGTFENYYPTIDADPGTGTSIILSNGMYDIFAMKLNSSGIFQWVKTIGTPQQEKLRGLAVDANGNMTAGIYNYYNVNNWDVNPGTGVQLITPERSALWNLSSTGNFNWVAGLNIEQIWALTNDNSDNLHVIYQDYTGMDMFYSKYSAAGVEIISPKYTDNVIGNSIQIDNSNNIYIAGETGITNFDGDPTANIFGVEGPGAFNVKWGQTYSTIQFAAATISRNESDGTVTVSLPMTAPLATSQTVQISIQDNSTTVVSDYSISPTNGSFTLTIPAGATSASFTVNIVNDLIDENNETFTATITGTSAGLIIGSNSSCQFTIVDNDNSSSINENNMENLSYGPNPASDVLNVYLGADYKGVKSELWDIYGKLVMTDFVESGSQLSIPMNYATGTYILNIVTEDGKQAVLHIIQK